MPKFKVYVTATEYGSVVVEAKNAEDAEITALDGDIDIDWDDPYNCDLDISPDDPTIRVCDKCEGNPDDGLVEGRCGACRRKL